MPFSQVFEQSIEIKARPTTVERCITDHDLMHRWLNPALRCEPVGEWSTKVGAKSRFIIQIPILSPVLHSTVIEKKPGLIVWKFEGFFVGSDRWECQAILTGTKLVNRFEFEIPNPLIRFGFNWFAAGLTKADMQAQLRRLQQVAQQEEMTL